MSDITNTNTNTADDTAPVMTADRLRNQMQEHLVDLLAEAMLTMRVLDLLDGNDGNSDDLGLRDAHAIVSKRTSRYTRHISRPRGGRRRSR